MLACAVLDARLSRLGVPLVTLSNCRAYVWSAGLEGWACVADESFAASQYMPTLTLANQGVPGGGGGAVQPDSLCVANGRSCRMIECHKWYASG